MRDTHNNLRRRDPRKPTLGMWVCDIIGVASLFGGTALFIFIAYGLGF